MKHPSFLELDRLALGAPSPEVRDHVRTCDRCSGHLARLGATDPVPAWARAAQKPDLLKWLRSRWAGGFAVAAVAGLAIVSAANLREPAGYVAAKGMPSVAVYVQRDGRTTLWNGTESLQPGDRIRLKVAPEGYRWIAASAVDRSGALRPLYEGPLENTDEFLLPESWRLDGAPGPETIHVALDGAPVPPRTAAWTTTLTLPKESW